MIRPSELVELPFLIFIYIADIEQQASVNEVEQFNELINNSAWCRSPLLKEVLKQIVTEYDRLWKNYGTPEAHDTVSKRLKELLQIITTLDESDYNLLRRDLIEFSKSIAKASNLLGVLSQQKETALITIENLLAKKTDTAVKPTDTVALSVPPPKAPAPVPPLAELWPLSTLITDASNIWKRGKIRLKCIKIIQETHDVKTFCFINTEEPLLFLYKPGQFLSLELAIDGKKVVRSYTISSTPSRPFNLSITVKRVRDGLVSNWLHNNLKEGDEIQANGPHGKFNCFDIPAQKLLLISGGSGITPVMSILRWLCDTGSKADIVFIHNAQTPHDLIFCAELSLLSAQNPHLRVALCVSRTNAEPWSGYVGRFTAQSLALIAPDFHERTVYICGPDSYMEAVQHIIQSLGFDMNNYHAESFGKPAAAESSPVKTEPPKVVALSERAMDIVNPTHAPTAPPRPEPPKSTKPAPTTKPAPGLSTLIFIQQNKQIVCGGDDTILEAAESEGIDIPYSCRAGTCGTCKVLKLEGEVEADEVSGLTETEASQGFILACSTKARGRVVLDV